jgi:hypothetical protein
MILVVKGKDKKREQKTAQTGFEKKNISFSFAFVNFLANMSYTPTLGSKLVYTISSTWGPKLSNNKKYLSFLYATRVFPLPVLGL